MKMEDHKGDAIETHERDDWGEKAVEAVRSGATDFSYTLSGDSIVFACKQGDDILVVDAQVRRKKHLKDKEDQKKENKEEDKKKDESVLSPWEFTS